MKQDRYSDVSITFLITCLGYGGAETQLVRLAKQHKARGWKVAVISMLPPEAFADELKERGIFVDHLDMRRGIPNPIAFVRLVRLLKQTRPHILTSFMFHANLLGRIAGKIVGVPVIISSIRNENFGGLWRERVTRWTEALVDITTTNSHFAANSLMKRGVVSTNGLRVVPNAITVENYRVDEEKRRAMRGALGIGSSQVFWLAIGRLEEQKDYPNLLRAFSKVVEGGSNAILKVVGEGPLLESLKHLVGELGLSKHVEFLGLRRDIPCLLNSADCFVLSSAWEGLPNVVMEALSAGVPSVATRVGGVPELIEEGKSGYLVPPGDPDALAGAMRHLMGLPKEVRQVMGRVGKQHIQELYELETVVNQWENLYNEMLQLKACFNSFLKRQPDSFGQKL